MSDLINRKLALKALRPIMRKSDYFYEMLKAIQDIPSAQSDVIRCKDCKYYKTKFCALDTWTNEITIYNAQPDDFCSKAKRKTDG